MGFGTFGRTFGVFDKTADAAAAPFTLWDDLIEYLPLSEESAGSAPVERVGLHNGMKFTDATNVPHGTGHVYARVADFTLADGDYLWRNDYRLCFPSSFTVAAWIRTTGADEVYRGIVDSQGAGPSGYSFFINQSRQLVSNIYRNAAGEGETNLHNVAITANAWHLVRMWYDADLGLHCNQIDTGAVESEERAEIFRNANETILVGRYGSDKPWSGQIGPVMWWDRVLTDAEWLQLYNAGAGVAYDGEGAAVGWLPTDIEGCDLWLAADDLNGNGDLNTGWADEALVGTWADKSGNANHLAQADADKQPQYRSTTAQFPSPWMPCVDFASKYLAATEKLTGSAGTVFAVLKVGFGPAAYQALLGSADEGSANQRMFLGPYYGESDINQLYVYHEGNAATDQVKGSTTVAASTVYLMMWQSNGSAYAFRVNGAAETPAVATGSNSGDWFSDLTGADNTIVGACKFNSIFFYLSASLGELIVYNSALSAGDIAAVEAYLAARWGITL